MKMPVADVLKGYLMELNSEQGFWGLGENPKIDFWIPEINSKLFSRPKIGEGPGWR
jgi:hypothetical protein